MKGAFKLFKKTLKGSSSRGSSHREEEESSRQSSRRHSVSDYGSSDSGRTVRHDQGLRSCSTRFNADEVLEPARRPRTRSSTRAQVHEPMNIDEDEDQWKYSAEGFSLRTSVEEARYHSCLNRLRSNYDLDLDLMGQLEFTPSIQKFFDHLGWGNFIHISALYHRDLALEILATMDIIISSDLVHKLRFRVREEWKELSISTIGSLLGFMDNALPDVEVNQNVLDNFWLQISSSPTKERVKIVNPIIRIIHRYMSIRVIERLDDTKVQNFDIKWIYLALCRPTKINPTGLMVDHWITQRNRATGLLGFGHYLSTIAFAMKPDIILNPEMIIMPQNIDEKSLKNGKYIFGNSTSGYYVSKTKFKIPDPRLAVFAHGRVNWLEEFMFPEENISEPQPTPPSSSGWGAWEANPTYTSHYMGAGSSQGPVFNPRPVSSFDPTATPVFQPSTYVPPATFVPRTASNYTSEQIAGYGMPYQAYYGMENAVASNYQRINNVRQDIYQIEQNNQTIEEYLHNLRLWSQDR